MLKDLALFGGSPVRTTPYPEHTTIVDDAEEKAVIKVLRGGHLSGFSARPGERFLGGPYVRKMESDFAEYFGVKHAVSFNSATSALHAAVAAANIGPGDEVITSPYTMSATATSILMKNAIPVFSDIEDKTYGIDPECVREKINDSTKAVLTVNIFGHASNLEQLNTICRENNLVLIEDNSQSPGAIYKNKKAGTIGGMGVLSLNYHKIIQTGEGGLVITNSEEYYDQLTMIRNHGEVVAHHIDNDKFDHVIGYNYRLTEMQAAMGIEQLKKLDYFLSARRELSEYLTSSLAEIDFISTPTVSEQCTHAYYLYPFKYIKEKLGISRELFAKLLQAEGVSVACGYVVPLYKLPIYKSRFAYGKNSCPFECHMYKNNKSLAYNECPVTEKMFNFELMTTDICKYPNSKDEVDEFTKAILKIQTNIEEIKSEHLE